VKFTGHLYRISDVITLGKGVFFGRGGIALKKEAAALLQGTLRGAGEMVHVDPGVRPDCHGTEGASVRKP
jgi:hypothetical protein